MCLFSAPTCAQCADGLCPVLPGRHGDPADANWQPASQAAHCRITVGDGSAGSGTLVARNATAGLVLTCSHLFDESASNIIVAFPSRRGDSPVASGARYGARLIDRDRAHDLAALMIRRPEIEPVDVSDDRPAGPLAACGYGSDGRFRCVRGEVVGQATPVGAGYPSLVTSGAVRPGDSGGGVLDVQGRLVGVIWGQRDGQTYLTCGQPLRQFLGRVLSRERRRQGSLPSGEDRFSGSADSRAPNDTSSADWSAWQQHIETQIAALRERKQDKGGYLTAEDLDGYARHDEVDGGLQGLAGRLASMHDRVAAVRQQIDSIVASRVGMFEGLSLGKLLAGTLGLSGPLAAAVILVGGLAGRRVKSRVQRQESSDGTAPDSCHSSKQRFAAQHERLSTLDSTPIAVDSPPLPQRAVPETHYVPYERDTFAKAYQWAAEQVARKYPGTLDVLSSLDSLIKQQLNAQPTKG